MIQDIYNAIAAMEPRALRSCVSDLKKRNDRLTLDERIKLHFGLVQMDCLDSAMYQMQLVHNEISTIGISSSFLAAHPDFKVHLMSVFHIWEDSCGNIHVDETNDCCCGDCAGAAPCCCSFLGIYFCIFACCGESAGVGFLNFFCSTGEGGLCYGHESGFCCNCQDGGVCCIPLTCCTDCCTSGFGC